ncbi:Cys-tRNA(Pro)/Cys-tRNA(Cys) deacylase [Enterococcus sp. PF1-24]|uniref:Cys-tRNA(Pro) deacylase n=1 Tax=unclassified Enterococcus TaxID=2608891 RepID=UPI0024750461|nr:MULTISPECIES: Cys-tRNA(Pro) deacylase [unclassified Enterococcus]MDH6365236.1 Cys-tRNA(Pro)/Cys-tRNA(Cys) deacylase [Enterococcus sp. PFB1-1]MDH6402337.1 Cys-tRNA(Pro)/Cys-tRNA(Cys) deacylase [Enterococcus sp. PF1-24]
MAKKKAQKTNALRLLEQKKIVYQEHEYQWAEAQLAIPAGKNPDEIFKTLVAVGNKTGPLVAVIPINHEVDLKKLAKASGNKKVEMLPLKELEETTGYIRGGCSPVGMKKLLPTYFEEAAANLPTIVVSAGKRGLQMEVAPQELASLVKGKFADLIVKE